ncbi:hypothetical protein [Syntrophaceticus schinkii]|jgi:predicted permease|uniref:Uncharacterized protein n=1 Tax=Syntrophaceticus schinkii TaxID=499207 RepID=A0A0B7MAR3_9FIRM|nr:hypothetical protein [Syntrophaceticus schinkii]MDD4262368.1 hypothetical protein [Syntrophaceticus schinkii]CEO87604.1 hypothetical protein SSCH_1150013 [Syntrophaceticus schinkii]
MSKVEKMVKKNYELSKKLTPENDAVYTDIVCYLRTSALDELEAVGKLLFSFVTPFLIFLIIIKTILKEENKANSFLQIFKVSIIFFPVLVGFVGHCLAKRSKLHVRTQVASTLYPCYLNFLKKQLKTEVA